MKIKAYFVTYKNDFELNKTLLSFENSGIANFDHEIIIVNNSHDEIFIEDSFRLNYRIISNHTRPDFSTGHLARNWNECLIDGFRDVDNPDCDVVILSQNDNLFIEGSIHKLVKQHETLSFIQNGNGDSFHSYTVEAIKKVGLWDERFCGLGYQEADYFLRQRIFNPRNSSINDKMHQRFFNKIDFNILDYSKQSGFDRCDEFHHASLKYHELSRDIFRLKWGELSPQNWKEEIECELKNQQFIMYPYFESKFAIGNANYIQYL
jgi:hypothetical protein